MSITYANENSALMGDIRASFGLTEDYRQAHSS
jgi:hypothetical protein